MSFTRTSYISWLFILFLAIACEANAGFIATKGSHFELNGSPFLFNGFNSYWLMHVAAEPSERYKVTEVLEDASAAGLSVCRTWAFSDGGDRALHLSPGVYDERVFQAWVREMASYVKSLDNKHLLEIGMEGFYGDSVPERKSINPGYQVGTDFINNHLIKEIDFATIHAYTDQWLSGQRDDAQLAWMKRWITSHWQDARTALKKPLVLAEFGKSSRGQGSRDKFMSSVYGNIYNLAKEGGTMAGSLVWQLLAHGMENYDDGYCIVLGQNPSFD